MVTAENKLHQVTDLKKRLDSENKTLKTTLNNYEQTHQDQANTLNNQIEELTKRFTFQQKNADEVIRRVINARKTINQCLVPWEFSSHIWPENISKQKNPEVLK